MTRLVNIVKERLFFWGYQVIPGDQALEAGQAHVIVDGIVGLRAQVCNRTVDGEKLYTSALLDRLTSFPTDVIEGALRSLLDSVCRQTIAAQASGKPQWWSWAGPRPERPPHLP